MTAKTKKKSPAKVGQPRLSPTGRPSEKISAIIPGEMAIALRAFARDWSRANPGSRKSDALREVLRRGLAVKTKKAKR